MKVCDLALFSLETSSGVKTHIANKIDYVGRREHLEHVVIVPGREPSVRTQGRSKVIVVRGVPTFYPGVSLGINIGRIAHIVEQEAPDIIELNCQYTLGWAAFLATRHRRSPIVGVYHTDVPACARHWARHAGGLVASAAERVVEFYEGLIYRHCTTTIILNAAMRDRVTRLGVERVHVLPCAVDAEMFHPSRRDPALRTRFGVSAAQKVILYAGRLSPEKEVDVLLSAYARLMPWDFALWIVGDGPDVSAVTKYASAHPGVTYIGHIESRAALAAVYASADLFVTPGRYETFGMSTLEAISCGLPVVGIRGSGTASLVPPEVGRLVPMGDSAAMAESLVTIAAWQPDRTRATCHAFAAERYSVDVVFDQYFSLYRDLIAAGTAARSA